MKYIRLTKEQLESLHQEFIFFLASQQITANEWEQIKVEKPHIAEEEIDVFSDYIWDKVLEKVQFLDKIEEKHLYLFAFEKDKINLILLKSVGEISFSTTETIQKIIQNLKNESVEIYVSSKKYSADPKQDIFNLILQGAEISKGEMYNDIKNVIG